MIGYFIIAAESGLLLSSKSFLGDGEFRLCGVGTNPLQFASTLFALWKSSSVFSSRTKEGDGDKQNTDSVSSLSWIKFGEVELVYDVSFCSPSVEKDEDKMTSFLLVYITSGDKGGVEEWQKISSSLQNAGAGIKTPADCDRFICFIEEHRPKMLSKGKNDDSAEVVFTTEKDSITKLERLQSAWIRRMNDSDSIVEKGETEIEDSPQQSWSFLSAWSAFSAPFRLLRSMRKPTGK